MASKIVAGGYKNFGPTYNSTKFVRFGHEGTVNSMHFIADKYIPAKAEMIDIDRTNADGEAIPTLAGKIAALDKDGNVVLCEDPKRAVGLIVDDIGDIANASNKVSFYFRGGEYYISETRMKKRSNPEKPYYEVGDLLTVGTGANAGMLQWTDKLEDAVAVVTASNAVFTQGNMYENAGETANGGLFVGIQLRI